MTTLTNQKLIPFLEEILAGTEKRYPNSQFILQDDKITINPTFIDYTDIDYDSEEDFYSDLDKLDNNHFKFIYTSGDNLFIANNYPNCKSFRGKFYCSITLEEYEQEWREGYMTPCGHKFEWTSFVELVCKYKHDKCPYCRTSL